jgi:hypothetical protein
MHHGRDVTHRARAHRGRVTCKIRKRELCMLIRLGGRVDARVDARTVDAPHPWSSRAQNLHVQNYKTSLHLTLVDVAGQRAKGSKR